jgi:hypothetical protein
MSTGPYPTPCGLRRFFSHDAPHQRRRVAALPAVGPSRSPPSPTAFPSYADVLGSTAMLHVAPFVAPPQIRVMSFLQPVAVGSSRSNSCRGGRDRGSSAAPRLSGEGAGELAVVVVGRPWPSRCQLRGRGGGTCRARVRRRRMEQGTEIPHTIRLCAARMGKGGGASC